MKREKQSFLFRFGLVYKGVEGLSQIMIGTFILVFSGIFSLAVKLSQHELIEDPQDVIANWFIGLSSHFLTSTRIFIAIYILIHGIIKIFLAVSLWKNKRWAYPGAIIALGILVLYQIYRISHTHSIILSILTLFDLVIIWIILGELKKQRRKL